MKANTAMKFGTVSLSPMNLRPNVEHDHTARRFFEKSGKILLVSRDNAFYEILEYTIKSVLGIDHRKKLLLERECDLKEIESLIKHEIAGGIIAIIDWNYPGEKIDEVMAYLRNRDPINTRMILSAGESERDNNSYYEKGFDDKIIKLSNANEIIEKISLLAEPYGIKISPQIRKARILLHQEKYQEAIFICEDILANPGNFPEVLCIMGKAQHLLGEREESKRSLQQAVKAAGEEAKKVIRPLQMLLEFCRGEGNFTEILDCLKRLDVLNPSEMSRKLEIGYAEAAMGHIAEAQIHLDGAVKIAKKNGEAEKLMNEIAERCIVDVPEIAGHYLDKLLDGKQRTEAESQELANKLGNCLRKGKRYEEAIKQYEYALKMGERGVVYYNKAIAHLEMGDTKTAVACLRNMMRVEEAKSFGQEPSFWEGNKKACLAIGVIFYKGERCHDALLFFELALEIDPKYAPAKKYLEEVKRRIAEAKKKS